MEAGTRKQVAISATKNDIACGAYNFARYAPPDGEPVINEGGSSKKGKAGGPTASSSPTNHTTNRARMNLAQLDLLILLWRPAHSTAGVMVR